MVSVIVTSYNQLRTLKFLFASLERQSDMDFEIVIADDGSSDETSVFCAQKRPFPVRFVTQPDLGYRKSKILNQAVLTARSDYLIFLDADVILERHFIEDHLALRQVGHFVCGRRVDLGPRFSEQITLNGIVCGDFDRVRMSLIWSALRKDTDCLKRGFRVSLSSVRKVLGYDRPMDILGSNLGIWKADLTAVNGFNEEMLAYWGEDGDLFIRLRNSGKFSIGAKSLCVQFHVFHARRTPNPEHVVRYQSLLENREYKWAPQGLTESIKNGRLP